MLTMVDALIERVFGPWCQAVAPDSEQAACWQRIHPQQAGGICRSCWEELARRGSIEQRLALAEDEALPPYAADILVSDASPLVTAALADRDDLLEEHRKQLVDVDVNNRVLRKLAQRADLDGEDARTLLRSGDGPTLRYLYCNRQVDPELRHDLARHPEVRGGKPR